MYYIHVYVSRPSLLIDITFTIRTFITSVSSLIFFDLLREANNKSDNYYRVLNNKCTIVHDLLSFMECT